ncbi:MAG: phosphoenolpyruvate synthase [Candidatus Nanoclepta minutus]|uniref:pyruvate, water dikinase n=1 Tax=Candidatus Nanoclepta minutus TaxID=1940235 RepID=A0A397WMQ2_9ARCH|nr:MAG: phosphoenolpyruvate synthase [Candidatus Nanoclepta minutus]
MDYVRWFDQLSKEDVGIVGGKGANLGEMVKFGIPVPPGFVLTANSYWRFVDHNNLRDKIAEILSRTNLNDPVSLLKASEEIQNLFINGQIPDDLKNVIIENYKNLSKIFGEEETYVAVRSSATAEDLPNASFAGQQATFLNVKGIEELLEAVKKCWASLWTARAMNYRTQMGFDHMKVALAVVIQKQIFSEKSGVMFTVDPISNDISKIVIEASWGLGESIVSGEVTPDEYVVDKNTLQILDIKVNRKDIMTIYDPEKLTKKVNVPDDKKEIRCLSEEEIRRLAELGKKIEEHYGNPQDIEFAIDKNGIWIVQTRPVTTYRKRSGRILLKGISASPGIGKGRVKIIYGPEDFKKFEKGDVLVTRMTNPDFEPLMAIASAIITDEGGNLSHAAIVSRELGKPCVVGTREATKVLIDGMYVTVDGARGIVYEGDVEFERKEEKEEKIVATREITATKVFAIADYPETVMKIRDKIDGIGLLRLEFLILRERKHPRWYLENNRLKDLEDILVNRIGEIASLMFPKPVIVRTFDLRTDEYRGLEGGDKEPIESNPMIGWHGIRRDLDQQEILIAQIRAFKRLIKEMGYRNIWIMIPFVISWEEVKAVKDIMEREGLIPHKDVKFGIMVETPAAALTIEEIIEKAGIDFISFGTNDLTQLTLGVDRNNSLVQKLMNEKHPAVLELIKRVIRVCKDKGVYTSICGQAGSDPEYASMLVELGIDSISANMDAIDSIRDAIARKEKTIMLDFVRKWIRG